MSDAQINDLCRLSRDNPNQLFLPMSAYLYKACVSCLMLGQSRYQAPVHGIEEERNFLQPFSGFYCPALNNAPSWRKIVTLCLVINIWKFGLLLHNQPASQQRKRYLKPDTVGVQYKSRWYRITSSIPLPFFQTPSPPVLVACLGSTRVGYLAGIGNGENLIRDRPVLNG